MRRIYALVTVLTVALAGSGLLAPASLAVPPEVVFDETFEDEFTIPEGEWCEFAIDVESTGRAIHRHYLNKKGEVVRHQTWIRGWDTATNPLSGKSLRGRFSFSDFVREHEGEFGPFAVNGLVFHFNAPGAGIVLIDAGRVVFDLAAEDVISVAGPHQVLEGDFDAFCAALS
jgi:hypothetical protein